MIEARYTLTFEEWAEGQALWCKAQAKKAPGSGALLLIWYGFALLGGLTLGPATHHVGVVILVLMLAQWGIVRWRRKPLLRRAYAQATDREIETWTTVDDSGYASVRPDFNECRMTWRCFSGWKEGELTFILGRASQYCCIPKRVLSADHQDDLRNLVRSKLS